MATLIDGHPSDKVSALDRGLAYGDGIYRTVELLNGGPRLWRWQWQRLVEDCARLSLPCPDEALLLAELAAAAHGIERAVAKITLTRGLGQRGYAMPADAVPTRIVTASPWGGYPEERYSDGVTVRRCDLTLSRQPKLAGIKHLNRLENVLARSEWSDPAVHEGLLFDEDGTLVEATMSNLFALQDSVLFTPKLDRAGVAGALRAWLIDAAPALGLAVRETSLAEVELLAADALLLTNSLIGVWPVATYRHAGGEARWRDFELAHRLNERLAAEA
ncbi:aminodeoxychorismate lyase [Crenobacter cavernae]|uniref:aminodeoxychorismate lyase n=1 Tax=Crenobacter cavernae TaxID=2290923 RepID=A0A345Y703_9NEIS|nr:aminodeoxychorismate lyase [Crenobacter cavernae]AXK39705.1 aminodeoxychorismate lyase [Crenobacter cavernae]